MTFIWSNIYSSTPRKDGLQPNTKLTFIWSYAVHNRQKRKDGLKPNTKLTFIWSCCCSESPRRKDGVKPNTKLTFIWSYRCSQSPRRKDGLKPNTKLTFIWSYAVQNRQKRRMAWSRTRSWPSFGQMLFTIAKKKGWLEAEHEVDLHTVILLFQVVKKKGWFETEHEEDLHLVTCLFKIGKKVWIENSRGADLQMVTYRSRTLSKYQFVLRKYWLGSCRATSSLSLS